MICTIQARMQSTRLPGKMLLTLNGETIIARAWRTACEAFGEAHVIVALPTEGAAGMPLINELHRINARYLVYGGAGRDVLGRLVFLCDCLGLNDDTAIVRYTPDDVFKDVESLQRVAAGDYTVPVEQGGELMTAGWLRRMHSVIEEFSIMPTKNCMIYREHIGLLLPQRPEPPDGQVWEINSREDYNRAVALLSQAHALANAIDDMILRQHI